MAPLFGGVPGRTPFGNFGRFEDRLQKSVGRNVTTGDLHFPSPLRRQRCARAPHVARPIASRQRSVHPSAKPWCPRVQWPCRWARATIQAFRPSHPEHMPNAARSATLKPADRSRSDPYSSLRRRCAQMKRQKAATVEPDHGVGGAEEQAVGGGCSTTLGIC